MSVTSVNGKTGEVTLKATDVEAVRESEVGQPNGVATLDSSGALLTAQLPGSVVISSRKALTEVSGVVKVNFAEGSPPFTTFPFKLTGATEFEPTNLPSFRENGLLIVEPNGHTFLIKGIAWLGAEPVFGTTGRFGVVLFVEEGVLYGFVGLEGKEGIKGEQGVGEWMGVYSAGTTYTKNEIVQSGGSSYICIKETKGNAPPSATYWELVAERGTLGAESVETTNIKALAITNGKIGAEAINAGKTEKAKAPHAKPAEGGSEPNAAGVTKKITFTLTGNGAKKEWVLKHSLESRLINVVIQKAEGEEPGVIEPLSAAYVAVSPASASEAKVVFVTAPGAGTVLYITVFS